MSDTDSRSDQSSASESESDGSARQSPISTTSKSTKAASPVSAASKTPLAAENLAVGDPQRTSSPSKRLPQVKSKSRIEQSSASLSGDELRKKLHPKFPKPSHSRLRDSSEERQPRSLDLHTPSPGPAYYPNVDPTRRHSPVVRLCAHDRFTGPNHYDVSRHSPGPVYYVETSWRKKPVSFSSADRFLTRDELHPSPGPSDYTPDDTKLSTKRSHKAGIVLSSCDRQMNATLKEDVEREEIQMRQAAYEEKYGKPVAKKRKGTRIIGGPMKLGAPSTFGTAHHHLEVDRSIGPGPAAYQTVYTNGKRGTLKGATLNTSSRNSFVNDASTVGAGHYTPNFNSILPRSPSPIIYYTS